MTHDEASATVLRLRAECSQSDWDSYGANPLTDVAAAAALAVLKFLPPPDSVVPTVGGGYQIGWHPEEDITLSVDDAGLDNGVNLYADSTERLLRLVDQLGRGIAEEQFG